MAVLVRTWSAAACAAAILGVATAAAPPAGTLAVRALESRHAVLVSAAEQTLAARALALVDGAAPSVGAPLAAGNVARSPRFAMAEAAALRGLAARRERLRAADQVYLAAETDVRAVGLQPVGDHLEVAIEEHTTLYRKRLRSDEPDSTAYQANRVFDFVLDGGRWVLAGAWLTDGGPPPITEPDPDAGQGYQTLTPSGGFAEYD